MRVESEITSAATRNYGAPEANQPAPGHSGQPPETMRFYEPPRVPQPQAYDAYPPPPRKSRAGLWILIALLTLLIVGAGMVGLVVTALRSQPVREATEATRDLKSQIEEVQRAIEEAKKLAEEAQKAGKDLPEPPDPPAPPAEPNTAKGLEKYKYPGATVRETASFGGGEMITLESTDSFDKIRDFYRSQIGSPIIEQTQEGERKAIFQAPGASPVLVTVQNSDESPGTYQILILRSPISIPKFN